ncbi:hypothetical protein NMY22_g7286 [Coprinellus aureogranulatus]|nr:hypothetical protein NMY22_g7286 [Coprinellus aureogranulatus]
MSEDPRLAALSKLIASANRAKASSYFDVASLALLVVDYLATLETEIEFIWPAPWSAAKVLYLFSRYLVFFDVPFAAHYHTALHLSPKMCCDMFRVGTTSIVLGVLFAEAILFLRVYALSGRNRKLMYYLIFQYIATHFAWISMYGVFLSGVEFGPSPIPTVLGCVILPPSKELYNTLLAGIFGFIMANEISIALMTFIIGLLKYRNLRRSPLISIFYRDGFFYFAILTAFSVANMIVDLIGPPEFRFLMVIFQRVMHSILSCRMVLHMRKYAATGSDVTAWTANPIIHTFQPMEFAQNPKAHEKRRSRRRAGELSTWEAGGDGFHNSTAVDAEHIELAFTKRKT